MVRDGINIGEVCSGSDGTAVGAKLVLVESFGEVCSGSDGTAVGAKLVLVESFGEVCSGFTGTAVGAKLVLDLMEWLLVRSVFWI